MWKKYAYAIGLWLNFLAVWTEPGQGERRTTLSTSRSGGSPTRQPEASAARDPSARPDGVAHLLRWASARHGVLRPGRGDRPLCDSSAAGSATEGYQVARPGGYRRWRDLGLRGLAATVARTWVGEVAMTSRMRRSLTASTVPGLRLPEGPVSCCSNCRRTSRVAVGIADLAGRRHREGRLWPRLLAATRALIEVLDLHPGRQRGRCAAPSRRAVTNSCPGCAWCSRFSAIIC